MECKDHTVSGELFTICKCKNCNGAFTQDAPGEHTIGNYYKAEAYVSHTNSKRGFVNKLYQMARGYTLPQKRRIVEEGISGDKRLLDLGAGTGHFAHEMQTAGWTVTGLEPDAGSRQLAVELHNLQLLPAYELNNLEPESFDAITLWHVLEHIHRLHETLDQLRLLLKPKGRLFIAVPNLNSLDAALYGRHWAAFDVPRHLYHFSPDAMQRLLHLHDLKLDKTRPQHLDAWYISLLSSRYAGKGLLHATTTAMRCTAASLKQTTKASSLIYIARK